MSAQESYPDDNPKTAFGLKKVPMHLVPPIAVAQMSLAFDNGAGKYGPFNWREKTISSTVYYGAAMRHLQAWFDGEDLAPDSGVHHLAHVMACCAMVLDGQSIGKLNDNRPPKGGLPAFLESFGKPAPRVPDEAEQLGFAERPFVYNGEPASASELVARHMAAVERSGLV